MPGFSDRSLSRVSASCWRWFLLPLAAVLPAYSIQAEHPEPATSTQMQLDKAAREWQRGHPEQALPIWRALALQDDPRAWYNLAQAWRLGRGVPTDLNAAIAAYQISTRLGYDRARNQLALVLYMIPERRKEAFPLLLAAANGGHIQAAFLIAQAEMVGSDFPADRRRAAYHFSVAARGGIGAAWAPLVLLRAEFPDMDVSPATKNIPKTEVASSTQSISNSANPPSTVVQKNPIRISMSLAKAKSLNELMSDISRQTGLSVEYRLNENDSYKRDDASHKLRIAWDGPVEPILLKIAQVFNLRIKAEDGMIVLQSNYKSMG